jgi:Sigma-70 region 2
MDRINPAGGLSAARRHLVEIWGDPQIKAFARRYAGDPQVADDALQAVYLAMVRLQHLDQIDNLTAYFCRVLVRAVHRERAQLGALLVDDFTRVAEGREGTDTSRLASPTEFEDDACTSVQADSWHKRLIRGRDALMRAVPARSEDPAHYRAVIYAAAEQILRDGVTGEASEADANDALRRAYPEYFDQLGAATATLHQRFRRARLDVRGLLQAVVS